MDSKVPAGVHLYDAGSGVQVNFTLQIGSVTENVKVMASARAGMFRRELVCTPSRRKKPKETYIPRARSEESFHRRLNAVDEVGRTAKPGLFGRVRTA